VESQLPKSVSNAGLAHYENQQKGNESVCSMLGSGRTTQAMAPLGRRGAWIAGLGLELKESMVESSAPQRLPSALVFGHAGDVTVEGTHECCRGSMVRGRGGRRNPATSTRFGYQRVPSFTATNLSRDSKASSSDICPTFTTATLPRGASGGNKMSSLWFVVALPETFVT
jgi:hypothetical protein